MWLGPGKGAPGATVPVDDVAVLAGLNRPLVRAGRKRPLAGLGPRRVTLVRLSGEIARSMAALGRVAVEGEVHRPQTYPVGLDVLRAP